jgi:hypothetical protein
MPQPFQPQGWLQSWHCPSSSQYQPCLQVPQAPPHGLGPHSLKRQKEEQEEQLKLSEQ